MSKIPLGYPDNVCRSAVEKSEPFKSNGGGGGTLKVLVEVGGYWTAFINTIKYPLSLKK